MHVRYSTADHRLYEVGQVHEKRIYVYYYGDGDGDDDDYCSVCDCHDSLCYGYYRCDTLQLSIHMPTDALPQLVRYVAVNFSDHVSRTLVLNNLVDTVFV